jgi:hypothetical protein
MRDRSLFAVLGIVSALIFLAIAPTHAGTISLAWEPVAGASGYRVYYGSSSGSYTQQINVGNTTSVDVEGLNDCTDYYLAVKAYNGQGESTSFSNEVSGWARPEIDSYVPGTSQQGSQVTINFDGANFQQGAELLIDTTAIPTDANGDPLVRIENISVLSCTRIQALMTVEPLARGLRSMEVGQFALGLEVRNPDEVFGTRPAQLDVAFNPERADINRSNASTQDRVDGEDLVWLAHAHGSAEGQAHFNPDSDLDGDGLVDGVDLAYLAVRFGACWTGAGWAEGACP